MHVAGARRVDAFRAWAAARSARILMFDSVAKCPGDHGGGDHYEEDRVMPMVFGDRAAARVAHKLTLRRISPTNVKTSSLKTR